MSLTALTRSDIRTEVRDTIRRKSGALENARINKWIDWAQLRISNGHSSFREMRTTTTLATVDGTATVSNPSNLKFFTSLKVQDGSSSRELEYMHHTVFDRLFPRPETHSEDRPRYIVEWGTSCELWPIPDDAYTIDARYVVHPTQFASDTSTSSFTDKDQIIIAGAATYGFIYLRLHDEARNMNSVFNGMMREAIQADPVPPGWTPIGRPFMTPDRGIIYGDYSNPWRGMV